MVIRNKNESAVNCFRGFPMLILPLRYGFKKLVNYVSEAVVVEFYSPSLFGLNCLCFVQTDLDDQLPKDHSSWS